MLLPTQLPLVYNQTSPSSPLLYPVYTDSTSGLKYVKTGDLNKSNKAPTVVSLFSGAGGLDLGLEMAGFKTVACVEWDQDSRSTLAHNRPDWNLVLGKDGDGDIRKITEEDIFKATNLSVGQIDLVVGGPPCQPFSNIGKKQGLSDPSNGDLHYEYVRMVKGLLPNGFLLENVDALLQKKHKPILDYIVHELSEAGYTLTYSVLNAVDYGVPQQRRRFIMVGLRNGQVPLLPFPTHFQNEQSQTAFYQKVGAWEKEPIHTWQTVGGAFNNLLDTQRSKSDYVVMNISPKVRARMELISQGENFHVLPMDMRPDCWKNGKHQGRDTFGRLRLDRPSVTIRTAAYNPAKGMYIHPNEHRGLNSHELAVLQSFPNDWVFHCAKSRKVTLVSVGRQIGNAVPPLLAKAIGSALKITLAE